jgi:ParB family chromosome partitioning protein
MNQQIVDLEIDSLEANPLQPRGIITPESLVDLVDSIREHGILEPLVVAKTPAGYQIIAGERRWRASKLAGLKTVPVIIKETSPQGMLEMAIVENVQRTDLNPIDRAKAFERLIAEFGLSNSEISQRIGKSPAYVSNSLRLLTLPDALKDGLLSGLITEGHARALAAINDERAEDLARRMSAQIQKPQPPRSPTVPPPQIVDPNIDQLRDQLEALISENGSHKSQVRLSRSRAETRVIFVLKGGVEETEGRLQKIYQGLKNQS